MSGAFASNAAVAEVRSPEPIPLRGSPTNADPYPVDALGTIAAAATRAIMQRVQVPDSLAAHSILSAVALAVQGHVVVQLPTQEVKPVSLFLTTVADSGDRKTASDKLACAAIDEHEADLSADYQREKLVFQSVHSAWKSVKDQIAKDHKGDHAEIRDAVERHGAPPPEPLLPAMIVPPGSTQGVLHILEHGRPSVGLYHNDGGAWLGSWGMSDENLTATIAAYSDLWDGKAIKTLTKGEGYKYLPGRAFSFHVMFQSFYVDRMFGNQEMREQGFLARMLPAKPTSLAGTRLHEVGAVEPDNVAVHLADFKERLSTIIRAPLPMNPERLNALERTELMFDREGQRLFWEFYNHIEQQQGKGAILAGIRGFAGKAAENACRLAAVIHVFQVGRRETVIRAEFMAAGIELMNFYIGESLRLADHGVVDQLILEAEELSDWLKDKYGAREIGMSHIQQRAPRSVRKLPVDRVREICALLARNDHLTPIPAGATIDGKRCKEAWVVNVR